MAAAGAVATLGLLAAAIWTSAATVQGQQEPCSHVFSSPEFRLTSPRYPAHYPSNYSCTYFVRPYAPSVCRLQLAFHFFDVGDCSGDVLDVGGEVICGRAIGVRSFPVDQRGLTISFRSGPYSRGRGYDAVAQQMICGTNGSVERTDSCGGVFSSPRVLLTSHQVSRSYANQTSCVYVIRPASPLFCQLEIHFLNFSLNNAQNCVKERLEIANQDILCGVASGSRRYRWIDDEVRILYTTDGSSKEHGFEIYVTQVPCDADNNTQNISHDPNPEKKSVQARNYRFHNVQAAEYPLASAQQYSQLCCQKIYSDKVFLITSPGFPKSNQRNGDCVFVIGRYSSDVCRLRMKMKYFCVGKGDSYAGCYGGYLEVDGRKICGCHTGRTLLSVFSSADSEGQKLLKYVPGEVQGLPPSGFVIEIVQETCFPIIKRSTNNFHFLPTSSEVFAQNVEDLVQLAIRNKIENKGEYGTNNSKEQSTNVKENSHNFQDEMPAKITALERFSQGKRSRRSPYGSYFWQCNLKTWIHLVEELLRKTAGRSACPTPQPLNCQVTSAVEGILQSPNYPGQYPANLRCCYRIARRAGYCRVQVTVLDFNLELSPGCVKDYLVLADSGRYCGASLAVTTSYLDLTERGHADLVLATDVSGSGRGFRATFMQLPCSYQTTTPSYTYTTAWPHSNNCGDVISSQQFYISSSSYILSLSDCTFTVRRVSQEVCELQITMERFNLTCGQESLQIGTQLYCGPLTGNFVTTRFNGNEVQIVYRKSTVDNPGQFVIRGQQVADCEPLTLYVTPAARVQTATCAVDLHQPGGDRGFPESGDPVDCSYVFMRQPGMCGLRLTFDRFETQTTTDCLAEFLELEGRKFCGSQLLNHSRDIVFNGSDIYVPYLVEEAPKSSNWHFSYNYLTC